VIVNWNDEMEMRRRSSTVEESGWGGRYTTTIRRRGMDVPTGR
jgi:hypothetical protein